MIPTQEFEAYPIFGDNGTKAKPDEAKYAAGFAPADVLPAEWMNWAWNHNTKGITALNSGLKAVEEELNAILTAGGQVPNNTSGQVLNAIKYVIETKTGNLVNLQTTAKATIVAAVNEILGALNTLSANMSNYYTKTQVDAEFTAKTTISPDATNALSRKANGLYADCVPVGTVIQTLRTSAPAGYLMMNNAETIYDQADYPLLFAVLPDSLKNGNHFTLPDMTQRFVQGGTDLGSTVEAGIPNSTGELYSNSTSDGVNFLTDGSNAKGTGGLKITRTRRIQTMGNTGTVATMPDGFGYNLNTGELDTDGNLKTDESTKVYGKSNTVQPPAVVMNFMIKAK